MIKNSKYILLIAMLVVSLTATAKKKQLLILHTNDTHSCIMPLSETLADTLVAGRGGFLRRIAMLKEERQKFAGSCDCQLYVSD